MTKKKNMNMSVEETIEYIEDKLNRQVSVQHNNEDRKFLRNVTKSGAITIPASLRREVGIGHKDKYELRFDIETGDIILKRVQGRCPITGDTNNLININGIMISSRVISVIQGMGEDIYDYTQTKEEVDFAILYKVVEERRAEARRKKKEREENEKLRKALEEVQEKEKEEKKKKAAKKPAKKTTKKKAAKKPTKKRYISRRDAKDIEELLALGKTVAEISDELLIAELLIKRHLKNI